jgi:glycine hydroxymethyltransferase
MCSENVMSPTARELLASDFHHRYANSHGDGMFNGNRYIEEVDRVSEALAKKLFGARYVDLHSPSGSIACKVPVLALTEDDDLVMELESRCGGFSNLQQLKSTASLIPNLRFSGLPYDFEELNVDGDAAAIQIKRESPRVVVLGATFFLFPHPVSEISDAAREVGATVVYDAAHVFGLVAGKRFQDPFGEGADVITGSTHKTLPGPQAGIVLVKKDKSIADKVTNTLHQSFTGAGHPNIRAVHALLFAEMIEYGERYADQIVRCSRALAEALHSKGFHVVGERKGFTRSHMVVINVSKMGGSYAAAKILDRANITGTPSGIPGVDKVLYGGKISGIRFGTEEAVRLGMTVPQMDEAAEFVRRALIKEEDPSRLARDIAEFREAYQKIHFSFDEGAQAYKYPSAR